MSPPVRISLVIPLYNEGEGAAAALEAALALPDVADITLVDASSDPASRAAYADLAERQTGDSRVNCLTSPAPGRARQMNLGARHARGDVLVFLHCDTRLPHGAAGAIRDRVATGFSWGRFRLALDSPRPLLKLVSAGINGRSRLTRSAYGDQAMFLTRPLFKKLGGFADLPLMEDVELCDRLRSVPPAWIDDPVQVSPRRWERTGVFRLLCLIRCMRWGYRFGVSPARLAAWYGHAR